MAAHRRHVRIVTVIPSRLVAGAALAAVIVLAGSQPGIAAVAASDVAGGGNRPLERTFSDMRFIEPAAGATVDRMLVIDDGRPTPGAVRMAILERDGAWTEQTALEVALRSADGGAVRPVWSLGRPWLLAIDGTSVAVLADAPIEGAAYLTHVRVAPGPGGDRLVQGAATRIPFRVDDAAVADVDGDGRPSIVLASSRTERGGGTCQGTTMLVLDPFTLATESAFELRDLRIAGGVVGRFDALAGDDLFAYAYPNCPAGPDTAAEARAVVVRLADGSITFDEPAAVEVGFLGSPIRLDAAERGRHAVVARLARGLTLLEPGRSVIVVADTSARPLAAVRGRDAGDDALVAWMERYVGGASIAAATVAAGDVQGGLLDGDGGPERWAVLTSAVEESARTGAPPVAFIAVTDDAGCPDLFLPGAVVACGGSAPRGGAAWLATRPLAILPDAGSPLIVAAGVHWDEWRLPALPAPAATDVPGWWRHGPSSPFTLVESRAADAAYVRSFPRPAATIGATVGPDDRLELGGISDSRLFVSSRDGSGPQDDAPAGSEAALRAGAAVNEQRVVVRVGGPPSAGSGPTGVGTSVSLSPVAPPGSWQVRVVPIDAWGEVGRPTARLVTRDVQAPVLELDAPLLSAVWPVTATLIGVTEPRSSVSVGGTAVPVGGDGSFVVRQVLAPWPQTVQLTATDASGNVSDLAVTVVGGIDYRQLPLQALLVVGLLGAVIVSGVLGARRPGDATRGAPAVATGPDGHDRAWGPEIEDLPAGYEEPAER
jgi:hypothetical protein